jgi:hypothetical protein
MLPLINRFDYLKVFSLLLFHKHCNIPAMFGSSVENNPESPFWTSVTLHWVPLINLQCHAINSVLVLRTWWNCIEQLPNWRACVESQIIMMQAPFVWPKIQTVSLKFLLEMMIIIIIIFLFFHRSIIVTLTKDIETVINPLPSLMLQSTQDLNVPCRPKHSKALLV